MTDYTTEEIEEMLTKQYGELILVMDSDGYDEPPELHIHDTVFDHDNQRIIHHLTDGGMEFSVDAVETVNWHMQSSGDLGL